MRENKHKKAASAKYKRQHPELFKGKQAGPPQGQQRGGGRRGKAQAPAQAAPPLPGEETTGPAAAADGQRFHRREITNNWHRYELPDADADDGNGAEAVDFAALVAAAETKVAPEAGFRFDSEGDWNSSALGASTSQGADTILAVDCTKLGGELAALSLHERLNISRAELHRFKPEPAAAHPPASAAAAAAQDGLAKAPKPASTARTPATPMEPAGSTGPDSASGTTAAEEEEEDLESWLDGVV